MFLGEMTFFAKILKASRYHRMHLNVNFYLHCLRPISHQHVTLGCNSTFQYPDQDPCPKDLNADALFLISVTAKRIFLFYITFNCQHNIIIIYVQDRYSTSPYQCPHTHIQIKMNQVRIRICVLKRGIAA